MATDARLRSILPDNGTKSLHVFTPESVLYYEGNNVKAQLENVQRGMEFKISPNTIAAGTVGIVKFPQFVKYIGNTYIRAHFTADIATAKQNAGPRWLNNFGLYSLFQKIEYQAGSVERQILPGQAMPYLALDTCKTEAQKDYLLEMSGRSYGAAANSNLATHQVSFVPYRNTYGDTNTIAGGSFNYTMLVPFPWGSVNKGKWMEGVKPLPHHYLQNPLEMYLYYASSYSTIFAGMTLNSLEVVFEYYNIPSEIEMKKVVYNYPFNACYYTPYQMTYKTAGSDPLTISGIRNGECTEFIIYVTKNTAGEQYKGLRCSQLQLVYAGQTINLYDDFMADHQQFMDDNVENSYQAIKQFWVRTTGFDATSIPIVSGGTAAADANAAAYVPVRSGHGAGRYFHYKISHSMLTDLKRGVDYFIGTDFNHATLQLTIGKVYDVGAVSATVANWTSTRPESMPTFDTNDPGTHEFAVELANSTALTVHFMYKINSQFQFRGPGAGVILVQ